MVFFIAKILYCLWRGANKNLRCVIKIGSNLLVKEDGKIDEEYVMTIARQVSNAKIWDIKSSLSVLVPVLVDMG